MSRAKPEIVLDFYKHTRKRSSRRKTSSSDVRGRIQRGMVSEIRAFTPQFTEASKGGQDPRFGYY